MKKSYLFSMFLFLFFTVFAFAKQDPLVNKSATVNKNKETKKLTNEEIKEQKLKNSPAYDSNNQKTLLPYSSGPIGPKKTKKDEVTPSTGSVK